MVVNVWQPPPWRPEFWGESPAFLPFAFLQPLFEDKVPPTAEALNRLAGRLPDWPTTAQGQPIHFVDQIATERLAYERHIFATGEVPTRADNWHDFFNALVWLAFPRTKTALNAAHIAAMKSPQQGRGRRRDALTLFDESGVLVVSSAPELLEGLRRHEWRQVFWQERERLMQQANCWVFGHAILEKLLQPYLGLTAKAWLIHLPEAYFALPPAQQRQQLDAWLAAQVANGALQQPQELRPLPVLGWPGWDRRNAAANYYDNTAYFRPASC